MQTELYPWERVEDSLESHLNRHSRRSQALYLAVVAVVGVALALLPVIRVGVSVRSAGIVRPVTEKHEITARVAGFAEALAVQEHQRVEKGELLLTLRDAQLDEEARLLSSRIEQARRSIHDLELLTRDPLPRALPPESFRTPKYRQEFVQLANELDQIDLKEEMAARELERARALAQRQLVPQKEAEDREFQLSQVRAERELAVQRGKSAWAAALTAARMELRELAAKQGQAEEERALYRVRAPVTGTLEELASISPGSYVQGGERIAVISPLSDLVAEVYVTPRDIGLLRPGNPVRLQVDAFNYNDWGFVTGRVSEIADDFVLIDQSPVFRVEVALDRTHLQLKNGFRGELKKGMTLQARFMVTERTLWQLLRDDINDWLNPVGPA